MKLTLKSTVRDKCFTNRNRVNLIINKQTSRRFSLPVKQTSVLFLHSVYILSIKGTQIEYVTHTKEKRWKTVRRRECKVDFNNVNVFIWSRRMTMITCSIKAREIGNTPRVRPVERFSSVSFFSGLSMKSVRGNVKKNLSIKVHPKNNRELVRG